MPEGTERVWSLGIELKALELWKVERALYVVFSASLSVSASQWLLLGDVWRGGAALGPVEGWREVSLLAPRSSRE